MNLFIVINLKREKKKLKMNSEKIFIPLNDDLLFKETITHEHNRKQLVRFLEYTTFFDRSTIINNLRVKYESVLDKTKYTDKAMRGDVVIEFSNYKINLESYTYFDNNSFNKSTSYVMRVFSTNLERGNDYDNLEGVIQINLIDNVKMAFDESPYSEYYITNANNLEDKKLVDKFKIKYYRIDKIRNIPYNELTDEARWIRFFGAQSAEERRMLAEGDELLMELNEWVEEYVNDERTKRIFGEWAEKLALDKGIKQGFEKGIEQGFEKGIEQGLEKGIEQGTKEGKKQEKINIAKNLLTMNFEVDKIVLITGLSVEEVEALKN